MKINIPLLKEICEIAGAPGYEQRIRDYVINEVTPLVDEIKVNNMGNVYAIKKGKGSKRVMVGAHMDEIGFIVKHIDENGFVRFHTLGGFDPKTLTSQRVIIHGKEDVMGAMGAKPIHLMSPEERNKPAKTEEYFIDLGMKKEQVEKLVEVGNPITRYSELMEMGDCVNCKAIDNRISVYILIETLRLLKDKEVPFDIYGVFTVQEEVGIRGANVSAMDIQPDFGFGLDTTIAYDLPGASAHEKITSLGEGTAIKIMDSQTICDYRMVAYMKKIANENKIKWQPEILPAGGTDTAGIQRMNNGGSISGAVSIPTRHLHQTIEMAHKEDITASIGLLEKCLLNLDCYDWGFK
tara:strand:+ start:6355 stop:7407 length:1053 start_codon:yes stop_codon:yes gene_type:complete